MPAPRKIDPEMLVIFARRHDEAAGRTERGIVIREFAAIAGISQSKAYDAIDSYRRGQSLLNVANATKPRKSRKPQTVIDEELRHTKIIAGIKTMNGINRYIIPTSNAIEIAINRGDIPAGLYDRCRMDRLLKKYGLNLHSFKLRSKTAWHLTADYPAHVFVVDATPMNQYYMNLDRRIVAVDLPWEDKHKDDFLNSKGLSKIWIYGVIDMYSGILLLRPSLTSPVMLEAKNPGESAVSWLESVQVFFASKANVAELISGRQHPLYDCPLEGVPDILFCDKGSGIGGSTLVNRFCERLGSRVVTHFPGNASAKGLIESNLGAFKRGPETMLNRHVVTDINQLTYFYYSWCANRNRRKGCYDKWRAGMVGRSIRLANKDNFRDALTPQLTRTLNIYGEIEIDNTPYFVTEKEEFHRSKVSVYKRPSRGGDAEYIVELPNKAIVTATPNLNTHGFEDIKSFADSDKELLRTEVKMMGKQIASSLLFDDILPAEAQAGAAHSKVLIFPNKTKIIETHTPVASKQFKTKERARIWILRQTGLLDSDLDDKIITMMETGFDLSIQTHGYIPGDLVTNFANILNNHKNEIRRNTT